MEAVISQRSMSVRIDTRLYDLILTNASVASGAASDIERRVRGNVSDSFAAMMACRRPHSHDDCAARQVDLVYHVCVYWLVGCGDSGKAVWEYKLLRLMAMLWMNWAGGAVAVHKSDDCRATTLHRVHVPVAFPLLCKSPARPHTR